MTEQAKEPTASNPVEAVVMCDLPERVGAIMYDYINKDDRAFSCDDSCGFSLQVVKYSDVCDMIDLVVKAIKDT